MGVLLDESEEPGPLLNSLLLTAPDDAGEEVEDGEVSPLWLLEVVDATTAFAGGYYTYPGSLTTPACTEGVRWFVLTDTLGISPEATDRLHEIIAGFPGYDGYENNNRPTQPLNDRVIQRNEE